MHPTLIESVRKALDRRIPMVLYAFPSDEAEYVFFEAQTGKALMDESSDFGFFYAPFEAHHAPCLLIPKGNEGCGSTVGAVGIPVATTREKYMGDIDYIVGMHIAMHGGKTVYARRIAHDSYRADWSHVAADYFRCLPHTFRFLFATPDCGYWLGASPELLLGRKNGSDTISTMALAGTLRDKTSAWDAKNLEEHEYVTGFIVDTMRSFGLSPEVGPAEDLWFGPVRHLCHRITAKYTGPMIPLLNALSPTPALAGMPRDNAIEVIRRIEGPRSLYGGYVGVNSSEGMYAYVNLRSMCFNPSGGYCIYSGGGITALSDSAEEWLETESKSFLLRECIAANDVSVL